MSQRLAEEKIARARQQSQICLKLFPMLPEDIYQEEFCRDCTDLHKNLCTEIIQTENEREMD